MSKKSFLRGSYCFIALMMFAPCVSHADDYDSPTVIVENTSAPNSYQPLNRITAFESITSFADGSTDLAYMTSKSLAAAGGSAHGARVATSQNYIGSARARVVGAPAAGTLPGSIPIKDLGIGVNAPAAAPSNLDIGNYVIVNKCMSITKPGTYILVSDLPSSGSCLNITANNVYLECSNHNSGAIRATGVQNLTITDCIANSGSDDFSSFSMTLDGVKNANITNNQIFREITQTNSSLVTFTGNTVFGGNSNRAGIIILKGGSDNLYENNQLDGGWNGDPAAWSTQGADDGFVIENEARDVFRGNTVRNVYDGGFEGIGIVTDSLFENNAVVNAGVMGFGSFYGTYWVNDVLRNNVVSQAPVFAAFRYISNKNNDPITSIRFDNNRIENNTLKDIGNLKTDQFGGGFVLNFLNITDLPSSASNNTLVNNNFGSRLISFVPSSAFTTVSGNISGR